MDGIEKASTPRMWTTPTSATTGPARWKGGQIMLDHYFYTEDEDFLRTTLLPLAEAFTRFYDLHYPRDEKGKILFKPAQALETWQKAVNPLPEIAGLKFVLNGRQSPAAQVDRRGEARPVETVARRRAPGFP